MLAGVTAGWIVLGVAFHLSNQVSRGRGWWAIVRAAQGGGTSVRRSDAIAAWMAGAGAAGVVTAQVGDALRVWLLGRRSPDSSYALLTGTLVAEAAGDLVSGLALLAVALAAGVAPAMGLGWHSALPAGAVALALFVTAIAVRLSERARRLVVRIRAGCAPLGAPRAYARSVTPWQLASRACRFAATACFLAAFRLPVTPLTVLAVLFAQTSGRVVPFAPASLGASVVVLAATFGAASRTTVSTAHLVAFLVATTVVLTLVGAIIAGIVILRAADWRSLLGREPRAHRRHRVALSDVAAVSLGDRVLVVDGRDAHGGVHDDVLELRRR